MAPKGAQSARQGTQKARMRAPAVRCVGCETYAPKGVRIEFPSPLKRLLGNGRCRRAWSRRGA